jgi:hypothetical protein
MNCLICGKEMEHKIQSKFNGSRLDYEIDYYCEHCLSKYKIKDYRNLATQSDLRIQENVPLCPKCGGSAHIQGKGHGYILYKCDQCDHEWIPDYDREEYEKSIVWDEIYCHMHPNIKATHQMNPPIGKFFCNYCLKEHLHESTKWRWFK